jgi:hypothetical protein
LTNPRLRSYHKYFTPAPALATVPSPVSARSLVSSRSQPPPPLTKGCNFPTRGRSQSAAPSIVKTDTPSVDVVEAAFSKSPVAVVCSSA